MPERPQLNRELILSDEQQQRDDLRTPPPEVFDLPETILQFGTGAFLRGFTDVFVDRANRKALETGEGGGRVVIVGSTGSPRVDRLNEQDGLYTLSVQGLDDGEAVQRRQVIAAVSRAISSVTDWGDVLALAERDALELIVSNTTEVGITFNEDDADAEDPLDLDPPESFPGKLTAFLYRRAETFDYDEDAGVVILPCELVEDNGDELRDLVFRLAERWDLPDRFAEWLRANCPFPNTLVDRIVPGTPEGEKRAAHDDALGYEDDLLIEAETYRLWAIEGDDALRERLPFAEEDFAEADGGAEGIVVTPHIEPFRQRKVRILNGAHTTCVPAAYLCGNETIYEAMQDELASGFIETVMRSEIVPSLDVDSASAERFADAVLERFRNPYLEHRLLDITLHHTTKIEARVVPTIRRYYEKHDEPPSSVALGFACYLLLVRESEGGERFTIKDDHADFFAGLWDGLDEDRADSIKAVADVACEAERFWGNALDEIAPGFSDEVMRHLQRLVADGPREAIEAHLSAGARVSAGGME